MTDKDRMKYLILRHQETKVRLFKPNGTEIVLLPLDEREEDTLLETFEKAEKEAIERWYNKTMFGV